MHFRKRVSTETLTGQNAFQDGQLDDTIKLYQGQPANNAQVNMNNEGMLSQQSVYIEEKSVDLID